MSSAWFDATASTRPRIKRDVLFTETPDGVLFHNADGGFRLAAKSAYKFATLLVPHLNGERTVAEICQGMSIRQRERVGELVGTLYERGFARSVSSSSPAGNARASAPGKDVLRRYEAQIGYIEHYADEAEHRFDRFRNTRVAIVGDDQMARWCALSLVRNGSGAIGVAPALREDVDEAARTAQADGCPVDVRGILPVSEAGPLTWTELAGYDVVVVTGGPEAPQALFPLLRSKVPSGRTLIPAWSMGRSTVVGPLMSEGTAGCWACAVLRWGANGGAAEAADVWSSLALGMSALEADRPRNTATHGTHPGRPMAAMLGNLLGFEVFRMVTGVLPTETTGKVIIQDTESLDVTSEVLLPHPSCPICLDDTERSVSDIGLPDTGLSSADLSDLPTVETAREADALVEKLNQFGMLLQSRVGVFTRYDDEPLTQTPLKLSVVELGLGHGRQRRVGAVDVHHVAGARMRALFRAAETYAEHVVPARSAAAEQGVLHVAPQKLSTYGGTGGEEEVRGWAEATSLLTQRRLLVPMESVRPFSGVNRDRLFEATRAGMGAGSSAVAAAARGLLSAVAYEALARAVRGSRVVRLMPDSLVSPEFTFLVRSAANLAIDFELLDLQEQARSGVAVVLARSGTRWTVAAGLSQQEAAAAALRDLLGEVQFEGQSTGAGVSFGDPLLRDLDPRAISAGQAAAVVEVPAVAWGDVLRSLGERGRDVLVVPTVSADLAYAGISVARVLLTAEALGAQ
ncbi:TOMM precursor leader peptide-binding protein [Streptomyces sp. NPDC048305]|uniref:TOMM precursor leader peptide-binding protein n=1 Tax=Streptomyces sp. NPDC048305 TaxID=3365532 RepID=UPI0037211252